MNINYFSTQQAGEYLQVPYRTLESMRSRGDGPKFCKLGRRVVYRKIDLDAWAEANLRSSTSE